MEIEIVMANAIQHIGNLHHNTYLLAPIIEEFYLNLEPQPNNILQAYLLFPVLFNKNTLNQLQRIMPKSTLHTKFKEKMLLQGLQQRVFDFKDITNSSIFLLIELGAIEVLEDRSIRVIKPQLSQSACNIEKKKASKALAMLFNGYEIKDCYRILGLNKL